MPQNASTLRRTRTRTHNKGHGRGILRGRNAEPHLSSVIVRAVVGLLSIYELKTVPLQALHQGADVRRRRSCPRARRVDRKFAVRGKASAAAVAAVVAAEASAALHLRSIRCSLLHYRRRRRRRGVR